MKSRTETVVVVVVVATLFALPYLFFLHPSVELSLCTTFNSIGRNNWGSWAKQGSAPELSGDQREIVKQRSALPANSTDDGREIAKPGAFTVPTSRPTHDGVSGATSETAELQAMLEEAATADKTVIITTLNQAWATNGTMIDVFLESFHRGEGTEALLNHLVIVALDRTSFSRCRELHRHCLRLETTGVDFSGSKGFMSKDFLKMMWRRMSLLRTILELGYSFVFTDADILWFRNPFEHFAKNADFQISCDRYLGDPRSPTKNKPNCGYQYARSNARTIAMYRRWCSGGAATPDIDEQSLLNLMLKRREFTPYKVKIRFLPTEKFSGFCQKSTNMSKVVTMHANCCTGLDNKVKDLRMAWDDWEAGKSLPAATNTSKMMLWHVPASCRHSIWPSPPSPT